MSFSPALAAELRAVLADVVAIPVTPFTADGAIDWAAHRRLIRRMADSGVRVLTPNGNTGEFYALSPVEAADVVAATAGAGTELVAGIGLDTASAIAAGRHAFEHGARMVMVHQPVNPYVSGEGWIGYHREIAEALPELGVVLYVRGPKVTGAQLRRLGELCPNVVGVKYAVPDPVRFAVVAREAGLERFAWIAGLAELYAPAYWTMGAVGFTSGLVNVAAPLALTMLDALRAGKQAEVMRMWELAQPFEELRALDGSADNVSVVKEALSQLGLAGPHVRPTSSRLPAPTRERVAAMLAEWRARGLVE
jgi:4-hydroxy-tetrahydrodipicolinate synthase